jgi:kynurenine formamidase
MPRIIDLTHPLGLEANVPPSSPKVSIDRLRTMASHGRNSSLIHLSAHTGTHLDSPYHTSDGGVDIRGISLDRLIGPAVIWSFPQSEAGPIDVADLERATPAVESGDAVLFSTGWSSRYGTPEYRDHPWLTLAGAEWLRERGVRLIGVDFASPEKPVIGHGLTSDFSIHFALLDHGVLIVENLTNLEPIAGQRVRLFVLTPPVEGVDGFPARVIAEY